jgi:hypothetical protein
MSKSRSQAGHDQQLRRAYALIDRIVASWPQSDRDEMFTPYHPLCNASHDEIDQYLDSLTPYPF